MKPSVLDVLRYLFEHCVGNDTELSIDSDSLRLELNEAGFDDGQVTKAFEWLQGLADCEDLNIVKGREETRAFRVYTGDEQKKLNLENRGFLLFLEQIGVLNHCTREMVIDRVMALESDEIELSQLKWIVLMVLFNQPNNEASFLWMEDVVMDEFKDYLH